ncbi:MAG: fatty acid desaturase, partial [Gemmatimonadales bacterium]
MPWLAVALAAASSPHPWIAVLPASYFFLAGLRLVHDVFHRNLGLPRWGDRLVLVAMSGLMLGSMHAVRATHLRHHRNCLGPDDVEGAQAAGSFWRALITAPLFPVKLHRAAWRDAEPAQRRWIALEIGLVSCWAGAAARWGFWPVGYVACLMALGQGLVGFFAVWTVHHDTDRWHEVARTIRSRTGSLLVLEMFYHLEHHLFPRVPTCRLRELAARLDAAMPDLPRRPVIDPKTDPPPPNPVVRAPT